MGNNERIGVYEMAKESVATKLLPRGSNFLEKGKVNIASQMKYKGCRRKMWNYSANNSL